VAEIKYIIIFLRRNMYQRSKSIDKRWVFNIPADAKGWILDAICHEIGSRVRGEVIYEYNPKYPLPEADVYYFAHYWNYLDRLKKQPQIAKSKVLIWYTHPREIPYSVDDQISAYSKATKLICTNQGFLDYWAKAGLPKDKSCVILGGADPVLFRSHKRSSSIIGLSSSYYPRKGAERIHQVVEMFSERRFCLLGRNWRNYEHYDKLMGLSNFEYREIQYAEYPQYYKKFDVLLSMSLLEGGPIPLLEAMMSNVVPVASRTGFALDLISDGRNGYTFDVDAPIEHVGELIDKALALTTDIRETVLRYSWEFFAHDIIALADE